MNIHLVLIFCTGGNWRFGPTPNWGGISSRGHRMSRVLPQFVRSWDFWDADRGCWSGDNSIRVLEAPPVPGRRIMLNKETEDGVMAEEHNHDTDTMDDFYEDEENSTVKE